jgi:hypothetical protein
MIGKEVDMAQFEISQHLAGGTEENHTKKLKMTCVRAKI